MAKNDYDDDWAYLWLSGVWSLGQQLVSQRSSRSESREQKETRFGLISYEVFKCKSVQDNAVFHI